jgi:hypothetical protein
MINSMSSDVAVWFGLNAAVAAWCLYLMRPDAAAMPAKPDRSSAG